MGLTNFRYGSRNGSMIRCNVGDGRVGPVARWTHMHISNPLFVRHALTLAQINCPAYA